MSIRPFYVRDFADSNQCASLSNWIEENYNSELFTDANMGGNRVTTRYTTRDFDYPLTAYELQMKLSSRLLKFKHISAPFHHGMVASYASPGDILRPHTDPIYFPGYTTWHFNLITQSPTGGGNLVADGIEYSMNQGDLICYPVSQVEHSVTEVTGLIPRLMWVFGFCIDDTVDNNNILYAINR